MERCCDMAILGGGCAGVSLVRELLRQAGSRAMPRVHLIEADAGFGVNKTWGFWHPVDDGPAVPVSTSFSEWTFSCGGRVRAHRSQAWRYSVVEARAFFDEAVALAQHHPRVEIHTGTPVLEVIDGGDRVKVVTSGGVWSCGHVVDTRPPERARVDYSRMLQIFLGAEIVTPRPYDRPGVGLMESMGCDSSGFHFDYLVPLDAGRILVEATRFVAAPPPRERLEHDLEAALQRHFPEGDHRIVRRESGVIPMGLPAGDGPASPRIVEAGSRAGAVRDSSGYAFMDIQRWAVQCARAILEGGLPMGHPARSRLLRWMDGLLLDVLVAHPDRAPDIFMSLAGRVAPDAFVRFMNGTPRPRDVLAVMKALPAGLFLGTIVFSGKGRRG